MKLTILIPDVMPQFTSYKTTTLLVDIHVGFLSDATNILIPYELRDWILKNEKNEVIQQGQVNVKLNTFESFVRFENFEINKVYVFEIINGPMSRKQSVICTHNSIGIVNENFIFTDNMTTYGNVIIKNNKPIFIDNWSFDKFIGNGLIKNLANGDIYAYVPNKIYTRNRLIETYFYTPFATLREYEIEIIQIPNIRHYSSKKIKLDVPARIKIHFVNANVNVITDDKVLFFDLSLYQKDTIIVSVFV